MADYSAPDDCTCTGAYGQSCSACSSRDWDEAMQLGAQAERARIVADLRKQAHAYNWPATATEIRRLADRYERGEHG